ncbi:MAG: SDR family oxidoreductase [Thermodesulfobacteriota bacterium]|nr:SDR family oxidoreductase [Thermodesulfobacteriota bacterium]
MKVLELFNLEGKVSVVTGAGSGLGTAFAQAMAEAGAKVVCADINGDTAGKVAEDLNDKGYDAISLKADVSKEEEVKEMINKTVKEWNTLDIIFNNAGVAGEVKPIHELSLAEWEKLMAINMTGVFLCTKEAIKVMLEHKKGKIVNIASVWGLVGGNIIPVPAYTAAKGGVVNFTREAAVEYGPFGINVNAIAPGFFKSNLSGGMVEDPRFVDTIRENTLLHGLGQPDDLKGAALFLASSASDFVTGQILVVDDGYLAK